MRALTHVGALDGSAVQDILDCDPLQGPITKLLGTADVINPHVSGNYIVSTGGVDAMTLAAPTVGLDDNLSIAIYSDTLNAHTITTVSLLANGTTIKNTATFAAFKGAGVVLRAYNGVWQVTNATGITFS